MLAIRRIRNLLYGTGMYCRQDCLARSNFLTVKWDQKHETVAARARVNFVKMKSLGVAVVQTPLYSQASDLPVVAATERTVNKEA